MASPKAGPEARPSVQSKNTRTQIIDARRRLARSEARLALALESGRLGVWDWDVKSGRVLFALSSAYSGANFGASSRPVLPHYAEVDVSEWATNTHPDDVHLWRPAVDAAVAGVTDAFTTVSRRRTGRGDWGWVEARGKVTARDRRGRATRVVGTFEDVTEGMHEETRRRSLEASLLRSMRLTAIAEVAAELSHELNQPLAVAMSRVQEAERLVRGARSGKARLLEALDAAASFIERASDIVRRYRRLAGSRDAGPEEFDVTASVREVVAMFGPEARRGGNRARGGRRSGGHPSVRRPRADRTGAREPREERDRRRGGRRRQSAAGVRGRSCGRGSAGSARLETPGPASGTTCASRCSRRSSRPSLGEQASASRSAGRSPRRTAAGWNSSARKRGAPHSC